MPVITHCPACKVELTIPDDAGHRRLRCPKCTTRFYPGGPALEERAPASSIMAGSVDAPIPPKRAKVPPSSGQHPAASGGLRVNPAASSGSHDRLDIPFLSDEPGTRPPSRSSPASDVAALFADAEPARPSTAADAAALFRDDPAPPRKKSAAESRRESRRCPSCRNLVLGGMSLCNKCGLDLDTGMRHSPDELLEDVVAPPPPPAHGMPILVLMIGLLTLVGSVVLTLLSFLRFEGLGQACLVMTCLFALFASIQFLRGKTAQYLVVALLLGGVVDIGTMIVLPAIAADLQRGAGPTSLGGERTTEAEEAAGSPFEEDLPPPSEPVNMSTISTGVALLFVDALLLIALSLPSVKGYFHQRRKVVDLGAIPG